MSSDVVVRERGGWVEGGGEGPVAKIRRRYQEMGRSQSQRGGGKKGYGMGELQLFFFSFLFFF